MGWKILDLRLCCCVHSNMIGVHFCRMPYKISFAIILKLLIFLEVSLSNGLERKLTLVRNPGYEGNGNFTFLHVKADGPNDTLHYLWDFTSKPSLLLAQTSNNANLTVSWYDFLWDTNKKSIKFTEEPKYTFGFIFDKIWEFNDMNDTGLMTDVDSASFLSFETSEFQWELVDLNTNSSSPYLKMRSSNGPRNGSIDILVKPYGSKEHGEELPHLFHSSNSTQLDISINNFETNPEFNSSRFAFELVVFSQENKENQTFKIIPRKSLDDEHTPGVFRLDDMISPHATANGKGGGWLLWRKVSYTSKLRDIVDSTEINEYGFNDVSDHSVALNNTVIYSFHGYKVDDYLVQATNISFGDKQDGFYYKNNFTTWTFLVGYGYPLEDEISLLVILVISIGLGLPALLIVIGGIYVILRGFRAKKDELFLSR